jgi:acetate---CoA ligase (ADP-forming)
MVVEQFRTPKLFLALARRARELGKPIVLQHPGRSAAAKASAATHTGAMSGDYEVMRTLVNSAGALVVDTLEELIDLGELLIRWPVLPKPGAAVLTESGAHKGMMLDFCESIGLALPEPSPASQKIIGAIAPDLILPTNPLDLTAQALIDPDLYRKTLEPLFADERYGSVVLTIILSSVAHNPRKMRYVINALDELKPQKPVLFAMLGEDVAVPPEIIGELRARGVPFFRSPERALRALARVTEFAVRRPAAPIASTPPAGKKIPAGTLPEFRSKLILATEAEIPIPAAAVVTELASAKAAARQIGYPVALKAQAAALAHKSDAGGVVLNLRDEAALITAWEKLHADVAKARPGLALDAVLVEAMARPGIELILGARNDLDWGTVLVIGLGGVFAEALHDVRVLPPDLDAAAIVEELKALKGAALLSAFRGTPARDLGAVAAMAVKLAAFMRAHPEVAEIDLNPVMVYAQGEGALALDALIVAR